MTDPDRFDAQGYPTEDTLARIREWPCITLADMEAAMDHAGSAWCYKQGRRVMAHWKLLTHDYRPPLQGGEPIWDGVTLPVSLPATRINRSRAECAAGWNSVRDLAAGMRIAGLWPTGRPSVILVVEPTGTVVERGDKTRSSGLTILRRATDAEIMAGLRDLSAALAPHVERMAQSQMAWYRALARPERDPAAVETHLRAALVARGLGDWTLRQADDPWDAWDARDAWAARAARDARDAWAAWAVGDAWAALTVETAALMGWTDDDPLLLTTGIRDAYAAGLEMAGPVGPDELGWVMAP